MALIITITTTPAITATQPGSLIEVSSISAELSPGAENANCSISLDNGDGRYSELFASPPLGVTCSVSDSGGTLFEGVITSISLGATCDLEVES